MLVATARPEGGDACSPPFTVSGRVEKPGQVDRFRVAGKKGRARPPVRVPSLGLPLTPVVAVVGPDGKPLARAEPRRPDADVESTFTPPADGTYTVEVRDLYGAGGPRHAYRLTVRPPQPDFALTVAVRPDRRHAGQAGRRGRGGRPPGRVPRRRDPHRGGAAGRGDGRRRSAHRQAGRRQADSPLHRGRGVQAGAGADRRHVLRAEAGRVRRARRLRKRTEDLWLSPGTAPPAPKKKRR